jgi:tetratricopeptide (TPR) repeat protein
MKKVFCIFLACLSLALLSNCGHRQPGATDKKSPADSTGRVLEDINTRLRNNPNSADLYEERAKYYAGKKEFSSALADMKRVMDIDSSKASYFLTLADISFMANKSGTSKRALEKCHTLDPKNTTCLMKLAELYFYVKKYQLSINYLDEALKLDPYSAKVYFMKGMNYKETGDTAKAISSMQTAVEQDNAYYNAYIQLGLLCGPKHKLLAEQYLGNALKLEPNNPEAIYDLAKLCQDENNYAKAEQLYKRLLAISSSFFDAHYNLGVMAVNAKLYPEALTHFGDAISTEPKNARGYYGRGYTYQQMGDVKNAAADYRYALTLDPDYEPAKAGLHEMKIF